MVKYITLPDCFPYHHASELNGRAGYFPNINDTQLKAVNELIELVENQNLIINIDKEHEFLKLLRFLRARNFNVQKSFQMLKADVGWRISKNMLELRKENASDVLGNCDIEYVCKYFPVWIQGFDKQRRPVSYRQFGHLEIWNVLKVINMDQLLRFHAWETEQALRIMYEEGKKSNCNIETFVTIVDAKDWGMRLATSDAFTFIRGMASTDSDHYPERLGLLMVINAPSALAFAWRIIKGFLDDIQRAKIKIFASPNEWQPQLFEIIDKDQIPEMYGGTSPNPVLANAIKLMNPPTNSDIDSPVI